MKFNRIGYVVRKIIKQTRTMWRIRNTNVISLQMGKVGSTSLLSSIPNCYQTHTWSSDLPIKYFSSRDSSSIFGLFLNRLSWFVKFRMARKSVQRQKKVKIIIGVRDPVARNISGYFQSLKTANSSAEMKSFDCDAIYNEFMCYCPHAAPLYWFENEVNRNFGIDIYSHEFNKYRGWDIIESDNIDIFIYKLESIDEVEAPLSSFMGVPVSIGNSNSSASAWYSDNYKEFIRNVKFDEGYLNFMYKSRLVEHFYTEKEILRFYDRWSS